MTYTPVFWWPIYRRHIETVERFRAPDPWHGDRPSDYTVDKYLWLAQASDMYAIWSDADEIDRFLPDSLGDLYRHKQVPAAALPLLLKATESGMGRSDYLNAYQSAAFGAARRLYPIVYVLMTLVALFTVIELPASPLVGIVTMGAVVGAFCTIHYVSFGRILARRKRQQAHYRALIRDMPEPVATGSAAAAVAGDSRAETDGANHLLTLEQIEQDVALTAAKAGIDPTLLPTYGRTRDFAYPHIEVDQAYHFVVVERGQELTRRSTQSLNKLKYWIFHSILHQLCSGSTGPSDTPWRDSRRRWFAELGRRLGDIDAGWTRRWEAEIEVILSRSPFRDLMPPDEIKQSIERMIATLGIAVQPHDIPKFSFATFDDWYVEVSFTYDLFLKDRGVEHDRFKTQNLDALRYRILLIVLSTVGLRTRPDYTVAGVSPLRVWDLRQGQMLRQLNPAWGDPWAAEVVEKTARWPYADTVPDTDGRWPTLSSSQAHYFRLGLDLETGLYFLAIPVSNPMVDYEEYYVIDAPSFERFRAAPEAALPFVEQARARQLDHLLVLPPGDVRGEPW